MWVNMRNTHAEQNESTSTLISDVQTDMDFRRCRPFPDSCGATKNETIRSPHRRGLQLSRIEAIRFEVDQRQSPPGRPRFKLIIGGLRP